MPDSNILTVEDMEKMTCSKPGCDCGGELYIHQKCHPNAPIEAYFLDGIVTVKCFECDAVIVKFQVARRVLQAKAIGSVCGYCGKRVITDPMDTSHGCVCS